MTEVRPTVKKWEKPTGEVFPNQNLAAYQSRLLDQRESLHLDSERSPSALTAIICTIDERTGQEELVKMLEYGVRAFRLDMAHCDEPKEVVVRARRAVAELSEAVQRLIPVAFVLDLRGPYLLTGKIKGNKTVTLEKGSTVRLTTHPAYDEKVSSEVVYVHHKTLHRLVSRGTNILLDYGRIHLQVRGVVDNDMVCEVLTGGELSSCRRVTLPGKPLDLPDLTHKDWEDIEFALQHKLDGIFLPHTVDKQTYVSLRSMLDGSGSKMLLFLKVESRRSYDYIDDLVSYCDGLIIDRGALSVELSTEKVLQVQKTISAKCNRVGVPVYSMTDYLNSMNSFDCPTLAEVSDVTSAVLEGVDGLILTTEATAGGSRGLQTVSVLCREAESHVWQTEVSRSYLVSNTYPSDPVSALCLAAVQTAMKASVAAIFVCTSSGLSAKVLSAYRPRCPVIAVSKYGAVARPLSLYRGIWPVLYTYESVKCWAKEADRRLHCAVDMSISWGISKPGDLLLLISPWRQGAGFTNQMRIVWSSGERLEDWAISPSVIGKEVGVEQDEDSQETLALEDRTCPDLGRRPRPRLAPPPQ